MNATKKDMGVLNEQKPPAPAVASLKIQADLDRVSESAGSEAARLTELIKNRKSYLQSLAGVRVTSAVNLTNARTSNFPSVRCDLLASEAAALVARCVAIRSQWESVYETSYAFLTDIERFTTLDAVFQQQEANGFYDVDAAISAGDALSNAKLANGLSTASWYVSGQLEQTVAKYNEQSGWMQLVGWLSHISGYGNSGDATASVTWNGQSKGVVDFSHDAATALSWNQLDALISQLHADSATRGAQVDSVNARVAGLQARATWDQKNKVYRKAQVEAIRAIYREKLRLVGEPDGPLNYSERLDRLQKMYAATLVDAISRLTSVSEGLQRVFGIDDVPLPQSVKDALSGGTGSPSAGLLDDVQTWLDDIASRLIVFLQGEQIYSCSVSIRELVKPHDWNTFRENKQLSFIVPEPLFADQYHVRLRAVALTTRGVRGSLSCVLKPPASSYYIHKDGTKAPADQGYVRPLRQSRAMPAGSSMTIERFGINPIYNCSPMGTWELTCAEHTSLEEPTNDLDDILLELVVAGQ